MAVDYQMLPQQTKNSSLFRSSFTVGKRNRTFSQAMVTIAAIALIEIFIAGWKLVPEFVSEFGNWQATREKILLISPTIAGSLPDVQEANAGAAALSLRRAILMETSGQTVKALALLKSLQTIPNLPSNLRTEIRNHIHSHTLLEDRLSKKTDIAASLGTRDDVDLQLGSTLGIIECKLMDGKPTGRILRVAMKARPGTSVDVQNIKIHVYFYEKTNDGEVVLTDAPIHSEWLSPPVDWSKGNPEILDVLYSGQVSSNPNTFYGYVVGIYYNGELQDTRAVPVRLVRDFPPPLFLATPSK